MGSSGDTLRSPYFKAVQSKCLSARFLINGPNDINFHVYVKAFNGTLYSSGHWRHTDNKWRKGYLRVINDVDFYVLITVTMRPKTTNVTTYNDIVVIDEIRLEKCVHDLPCTFMDGGEMDCPLTYKQGHGVWSAELTTSQTKLPPVLPPESFSKSYSTSLNGMTLCNQLFNSRLDKHGMLATIHLCFPNAQPRKKH